MKTIAYIIIYFVVYTTAVKTSIAAVDITICYDSIKSPRVIDYNFSSDYPLSQELVPLITDFTRE